MDISRETIREWIMEVFEDNKPFVMYRDWYLSEAFAEEIAKNISYKLGKYIEREKTQAYYKGAIAAFDKILKVMNYLEV